MNEKIKISNEYSDPAGIAFLVEIGLLTEDDAIKLLNKQAANAEKAIKEGDSK